MNTRIEYLYRDDANYKRFGAVLLDGELGLVGKSLIESKLEMGEMFVAEQVGIPSLRDQWFADGLERSPEDNGWHWLVGISSVEESGATLMPASKLVERFTAVDQWFVGDSHAVSQCQTRDLSDV